MNNATLERFALVSQRLGVSAHGVSSLWEDLSRRYAETHRAYHNLGHVDKMLGWLDRSPKASDTIEMAIFYHDCIYDPQQSDNEAQSAQHCRRCLGDSVIIEILADCERLIMATDPRLPRAGKLDEDLLVDIDLSILGASTEEYESYRRAIRHEYACVPEAEFKAGRGTILKCFLASDIYLTEAFQALEEQARANLTRELALLKIQ